MVDPAFSFEIKTKQIENDSAELLRRNKYNDFSNKNIYFSTDLSINRFTAFQHVGYCGGYGHDYDTEEIPNTDYFIIAAKIIEELKNGMKCKSILDFENIRSEVQNKGNLKKVRLISESVFLEYIERREKFIRGEIKMAIHEWEIEK